MNHLPKSVVREIRTLRSEGAGGGRLPPATRCAISDLTLDKLILQEAARGNF